MKSEQSEKEYIFCRDHSRSLASLLQLRPVFYKVHFFNSMEIFFLSNDVEFLKSLACTTPQMFGTVGIPIPYFMKDKYLADLYSESTTQ